MLWNKSIDVWGHTQTFSEGHHLRPFAAFANEKCRPNLTQAVTIKVKGLEN